MQTIEVSDCTEERLERVKQEMYGGELEDDTFLYLLFEEILDE